MNEDSMKEIEEKPKLRAIINSVFFNFTKPWVEKHLTLYTCFYILPFCISLWPGLHKIPTLIVLSICFGQTVYMQHLEYTQIKGVGFRKYIEQTSNKFDFISCYWFCVYLILMIAAPEAPVCYYPTPKGECEESVILCSIILIFRALIIFFILIKIQLFFYVYEQYGILTELLI